jgi:hypothetical protein
MNIILVTSVLRVVNDKTVFSVDQRKIQLLNTLKNIRDKIPNIYIVLLEGGYIDDYELSFFKKLTNYIHNIDITHLKKSPGEATLLYSYLTSTHFKSLTVNTISKISGRYYLNNHFDWNKLPLDKIIIKYNGNPWYETRYYRIPFTYLQEFLDGIKRYQDSEWFQKGDPSIENAFYHLHVIKHENIFSPDILGVEGLNSGPGHIISD